MARPLKRPWITAYTVEEVRKAAAGTSFHKISHNKNSKLLSFRNGSTRINVYYVTGTIGICIDHSDSDNNQQTKKQLFRRNVEYEALVALFREPSRIHTEDKGCYSRNHCYQPWTIQSLETNQPILLPDSALRWMYVASATGLSNSALELWKIAVVCTLWDSVYWDEGALPKLSQTRFQCGSTIALTNLLLEVCQALLQSPVKGVFFGKQQYPLTTKSNNLQTNDQPREDIREGGCCCSKVQQFMDAHVRQLAQLRKLLFGLEREIAIELLRWFFSRSHCGYSLVLDSDDGSNSLVTTRCSSLIDACHVDYANMAYTKEDKLQMCKMHGVLWEPGPS